MDGFLKRGLAVALAAWVATALVGAGGSPAGAAPLPDNRGYELVSPSDKHGADVMLTSWRAQAASDGLAFRFAALAGFGDVHGVAIGTDYVSVRSRDSRPGGNGWSTHGIMPPQAPLPLEDVFGTHEPRYVGELSRDLGSGVFYAWSPLTDATSVADVPNLYRRPDVRTPGMGTYELLTPCPLCDASGRALDPVKGDFTKLERPRFAGASADFQHVAFESRQRLTADAPAQPAFCQHSTFFANFCRPYLYEWDHGVLYLAGVLPDGTAAIASVAGEGVSNGLLTPTVVSDGSDGHARVFFTQPTNDAGSPATQITPVAAGNVFVRTDHSATAQLNVSERTTQDTFSKARFLLASENGERALFMTSQALTDDAPADGLQKLYLYDASRPAADPHNLTWLNGSADPGAAGIVGIVGASANLDYAYYVSSGGIYVWHDGAVRHAAPPQGAEFLGELLATGFFWTLDPNQARVSIDGRFLLFPSRSSELTGYDHGVCSAAGARCRELYIYNANDGSVACVSCNPTGSPAVGAPSVDFGGNLIGGTGIDPVNNHPLTSDGTKVFFSSPEALVPDDTNGKIDAYEYDVRSAKLALLSSGRSNANSYFLDASASGSDTFIVTRERLVGWDTDDAYDVYDARAGGGFPEPPGPAVPCAGEACRTTSPGVGGYVERGSASFRGGGNERVNSKRHRTSCRRRIRRRGVRRAPCRRHQVVRRHRSRAAQQSHVAGRRAP